MTCSKVRGRRFSRPAGGGSANFFLDAVSMNARPLLQGVFFCDIQWKGLFSRPGRKVQSLQTNTGFECTEVAPTSPSDRAVVHPVSSPDSLRDDSVLASRRGPAA